MGWLPPGVRPGPVIPHSTRDPRHFKKELEITLWYLSYYSGNRHLCV